MVIVSDQYVSASAKPKGKRKSKAPSYSDIAPEVLSSDESDLSLMFFASESPIHIETIYDHSLNLIQLKFLKNRTIPRRLMKIIGLIIPFHKFLYSITINSGLEMETIYEISKLLHISKITEICLDNTVIPEANYHILLDQKVLKHLSISKCKINDTVVKLIASKLEHPHVASKTLCILNMATNRITDVGAIHLGNTLRSNRQLTYLNLADNMISDKGAISILNSLGEFPLTILEIKNKWARRLKYLKDKKELMLKTVKEVRAGDFERKAARRRSTKPIVPSLKKSKNMNSASGKSLPSMESFYYDKAEGIVEGIIGAYVDPFGSKYTEIRNGATYCNGNNILCYLNLAYNNLTYFSIQKLYEVLLTQRLFNRRPKGLINVMIEGNFMPSYCPELQEIDDLLQSGFSTYSRISAHVKKKNQNSGNSSSK